MNVLKMDLVKCNPIDFIKGLFKIKENNSLIKCQVCGSKRVTMKKGHVKTGPPNPIPPRYKNKRVTWGYRTKNYTCECGNTWVVRTS